MITPFGLNKVRNWINFLFVKERATFTPFAPFWKVEFCGFSWVQTQTEAQILQPETRANNVMKNEAADNKIYKNSSRKNSASWRLSRGIEIDDVLLLLLLLLLVFMAFTFCAPCFWLDKQKLPFSLPHSRPTSHTTRRHVYCHPTIRPPTRPSPPNWGSKAPEHADSMLLPVVSVWAGVCVALVSCFYCWLHLIPQSEIRKNFN